jgi:hypothetical protein
MEKQMEINKLGAKVSKRLGKCGLTWKALFPRLLPALALQSTDSIQQGGSSGEIMK